MRRIAHLYLGVPYIFLLFENRKSAIENRQLVLQGKGEDTKIVPAGLVEGFEVAADQLAVFG